MSKAEITRQQESELPAIVKVQFLNAGADYQQGVQFALRSAVRSSQQVSVQLPIVFDDPQARNVAERLLYNSWIERTRLKIKMPRKYAYLEPTDIILLVDVDSRLEYIVRIVKKTDSHTGASDLECVADFSPIYLQNVNTTQATIVPQVQPQGSLTVAQLMDLPPLRGQDNALGYYLAIGGTSALWGGGALYQSIDGGANYTAVETTSTASTMGTASNTMGTFLGGNIFDETNVLTVTINKELASADYLAVLNGANMAALKSGTGWEIIQFRSATLVADNVYELRGFLRGRFGTEWAMNGHATGDAFVLLDTTTVQRETIDAAQLTTPILYKIVSIGQTLGSATPITITPTPVALKPYSPVMLGGGFDASNNATLLWTRRTRVGGAWLDGTDVPLSEASELYDVEILNGSTVMRTIAGLTTSTTTYSAAQQTSDFGSHQSVIHFKVYQVSSTVGRGYGALGSVAVTGTAPTALPIVVPPVVPPPVPVPIPVPPPVPVPPVSGAPTPTKYVATTGNDSNPGTQAAPWRTFAHAATAVVPGDVVAFMDGTYVQGEINLAVSGTAGNPITFMALNKGAAIISSVSGCNPGISVSASYITIRDFTMKTDAANATCGTYTSANCDIRAWNTINPTVGNDTTGRSNFTATGLTCLSTSATRAISIKSNLDNTVIENCVTHNMLELFNNKNSVIRYNTILGQDQSGNSIVIKGGLRSAQIYGNTIHNTFPEATAIIIGGTTAPGNFWNETEKLEAYNCVAYGNVVVNEHASASCEALQFCAAKDSAFYNNTVVGKCTIGSRSSPNNLVVSVNPKLENNIFKGTGAAWNTGTPSAAGWNFSGSATVDYNDFYNFSSAPTQTHGLTTDPLLVNAASDWHLQGGSPCIGAGATLTFTGFYGESIDVSKDLTGTTRTVPWALGAYK